jgi:hypothetical protein
MIKSKMVVTDTHTSIEPSNLLASETLQQELETERQARLQTEAKIAKLMKAIGVTDEDLTE